MRKKRKGRIKRKKEEAKEEEEEGEEEEQTKKEIGCTLNRNSVFNFNTTSLALIHRYCCCEIRL